MQTTTALAKQKPKTAFREPLRISGRDQNALQPRPAPRPELFLSIFASWVAALIWFHPRLAGLLALTEGPLSWIAIAFFVVFVEIAWLYGFYNIWTIAFAYVDRWIDRRRGERGGEGAAIRFGELPSIALLYTTYNDFVEASAASCVAQDYPDFTVYILDDSTDPLFKKRVDLFARNHPEKVCVVRRADRRGFKAGNLNHALSGAASLEPLFALADSDEILPPDFLSRLAPRLLADPSCGFIQANHRANPDAPGRLAEAMGIGIDIHWRWYQPLRNRFGFVMLLGHGALLRRSCWEEVGGFPELVSEDLAYAIRICEKGWRGRFAQDVVCYEDFPDSVSAFRVRFMKWTRGTCEFLSSEMRRLIFSPRISWAEKCDILLPTLNLPLSLFYFLFLIDANLLIPALFSDPRPLTFAAGETEWILPLRGLHPGFNAVYSLDFFLITLLSIVSPILCFIIEMARRPVSLYRFLCRSTAVYSAMGPIASLGVFSYLLTRKATFFVTGDRTGRSLRSQGHQKGETAVLSPFQKIGTGLRRLLLESHPGLLTVQSFELLCGVIFGAAGLLLINISFVGLSLAFVLQPIMHRVGWEHPLIRSLIYLPFSLIIAGVVLGGLALFGIQPIFFGYGFHF